MRDIKRLEQKIQAKMTAIKKGDLTPATSGIGLTFKLLKERDEASYENLIGEYKELLEEIKK